MHVRNTHGRPWSPRDGPTCSVLAAPVVLIEAHVVNCAHTWPAGIPMTKKKFAELELSLLHLQQNVEIPETHLIIHPIIQKAVEQVRNLGLGYDNSLIK